jgi:carboxyl-terminal processing protease
MLGLSGVRKYLAAVAVVIAGAASAFASPAQDLFDQTVFYLEFNYFGPSKVDLKALVAKYQAEVDKACAADKDNCGYDKVEPLIAQMIDELQDNHAYYLTSEAVAAEQRNATGVNQSPSPRIGFTHTGFVDRNGERLQFGGFSQQVLDLINRNEIKLLTNDRLVTNVLPNSPGEKAGLRNYDRWVGANDKLFSSYANATEMAQGLADFTRRVQAGETVKMTVLRGQNRQKVDISVKGEIVNLVNFPTLTTLENGVAVLRLLDFQIQGVGARVHALVKDAQAKNAKAIILDMRGNGGGFGSERAITGGAFIENAEPMRRVPRYNADSTTVEELFKDGRFIQRDLKGNELGALKVDNTTLWRGPVAVLVDGGCASACEYLAAYFQRAKRGPVLGEPTVGIGNTNSQRFGLINGGVAAMPTLRATWSDGTLLPEQIKPDVVIPDQTWNVFETGKDEMITKALEALNIK